MPVRPTSDDVVRPLVRGAIVVGALLLATVPPVAVAGAGDEPDPHDLAARAALAQLGLADRVGQLVMTSIPGTRLDARATRQLRQLRPGGVIVFGDNYRSRAQLTRLVRATQVAARRGDAEHPLALVSIDQEGGVVKRIADAPPTRSHPQLGAADRVGVTRAQAAATGRTLRELGINMDLAPVADLDIGPRRVMRERSFGRSARLVARHVRSFVTGLQQQRVAASVKHFPGFGGASVNSDDALARITRTRVQLRFDLLPFRAAVAAGTDSVMVSHGVFRWLDRRNPASTSPAAYRMLRRDLRYDGVAITDSLHAAGFTAATRTTVPRGCVRAVAAGADIALLTGTLADAIRCRGQLIAALDDGRLSAERVDEAALRVLRLKSRLGLLPGLSPPASAD